MKQPGLIGKIGAIINIVVSLPFVLVLIGIPPLYYNVKFLTSGEHKMGAGVWGLIFGLLIGGILVLID